MQIDRPDNKINWRVFAYDEGLASRVPYESAARTLTQSREQFSAYATRHGLAMTMEVCLKCLNVHVLFEIASFGVRADYYFAMFGGF